MRACGSNSPSSPACGRPPPPRGWRRRSWSSWSAPLPERLTGLIPADAEELARSIFDTAILPACPTPEHWTTLWTVHGAGVTTHLQALEAHTRIPLLTTRTLRVLERLIIAHAPVARPLTVGATHGVRLDVTEPIPDVACPRGVERLVAQATLEGRRIGEIDLPVCDRRVPSAVLADALAAELCWPIMGEFFIRTLYPQFRVEQTGEACVITRGAVWLGRLCPVPAPEALWREAHDHLGWNAMLQELWGAPEQPGPWFYDATATDDQAPVRRVDSDTVYLELSEPLPVLTSDRTVVRVVPTVGRAAAGAVTIPTESGRISPARLREQINTVLGIELCRLIVREAILGWPLAAPPVALRERLAARAANPEPEVNDADTLVLPRWAPDANRGALSRRAVLPAAAAADLLRLATIASRGRTRAADNGQPPRRVRYAPELIDTTVPVAPIHDDAPVPAAEVRWNGGEPAEAARQTIDATSVPILMYHRISAEGRVATRQYRVLPEHFEAQLRYLRDAGFRGITLRDWEIRHRLRRPLPGPSIVFTFDDGYRDFLTTAWPLLKRYGFPVTLFLVAGEVGGTNRWDAAYGDTVPLLDWNELTHLQQDGVVFGSHALSHRPLSALAPEEIVREAAQSRAILEDRLQCEIPVFSYPYGAADNVVRHLVGACGYTSAVTCAVDRARFHHHPLALPRLEIYGTGTFQDFVRSVAPR